MRPLLDKLLTGLLDIDLNEVNDKTLDEEIIFLLNKIKENLNQMGPCIPPPFLSVLIPVLGHSHIEGYPKELILSAIKEIESLFEL